MCEKGSKKGSGGGWEVGGNCLDGHPHREQSSWYKAHSTDCWSQQGLVGNSNSHVPK